MEPRRLIWPLGGIVRDVLSGRSPCPSLNSISTPLSDRSKPSAASHAAHKTSIERIVRTMSSSPLSAAPLKPRIFPSPGFEVVDPSELIEEETLPEYKADSYYPVYIGQIFRDRYQVVGKLGYRVTSTVWLARDYSLISEPNDPGYAALKIYVNAYTQSNNEVAINRHINAVSAKTEYVGAKDIRKFLSSFEIKGLHGVHTCIVQQALGITMNHLLSYLPNRTMTLEAAKPFFRKLVIGLAFLHNEAGVIHTDLQLTNLLLPVTVPYFYEEFEENECNDPVPRKIYEDRTIYYTRHMSQNFKGWPLICDFGEARFTGEHDGLIMPGPYRAPEVVMQTKWNHEADIWSFAMVAWSLVSPRTLFRGQNPETNEHHDGYLIAELGAVLGPPPVELMRRSRVCPIFWTENKGWKNLVPMPDTTLENLAADIEGDDENKEGFLRFLRRILCWLPQERPGVGELILDPWLIKDLRFTNEQLKTSREEGEKGGQSREAD
ncbi:CMGC/SRPK protein kinase [Helicocarpus griseus UAMH5409]|uniref:non-specific serine/threonine protein kinase n=1 Tax=Helicocarpus griseus UAMH5409 TaxID=1447875 RepID=A0A2B7XUM8_9EURO|nr:CMGC/SRPK protein kinase [Helicocarpus griseus UAMH5409]